MNRADFLQKTIRYLLLAVLALIVFVLGRNAVYGSDCRGCPEYGACIKGSCVKDPSEGLNERNKVNGGKKE